MKIDTKMYWLVTCVIATAHCTMSAAEAGGAASTAAVTVVDKIPFPEGPLFVNDQLHWVEYISNRLMRLDGETRTVLHEQEGCGHNGLSLTPNKQLVVICYESNEILYLDLNGNVVERIDADVNGEPFNHPNDIVFTGEGGAYITTSGPFVAEAKQIVGGVYFRGPGAAGFVEVADDVHFGNGIVVINDGNTLLVAEHNANRILSFDIADDGTLSNRQLFARMSDMLPGPAQPSIWLGPDGMRVDSQGNIFVAYYMGGHVVKMSSEGKFLQSFEILGIGVTNLTFYPDDNSMYVTAVEDVTGAPYHGSIWKIDLN
ncbi:MAG: SMP-30/gluconolactonase/LRE family protein [Proteobacteria bacterium]|nr:SMP-30/gluconolactonase/LRE family protein [Pseudomonadota bacterium]